jgi:hypothetical protein
VISISMTPLNIFEMILLSNVQVRRDDQYLENCLVY